MGREEMAVKSTNEEWPYLRIEGEWEKKEKEKFIGKNKFVSLRQKMGNKFFFFVLFFFSFSLAPSFQPLLTLLALPDTHHLRCPSSTIHGCISEIWKPNAPKEHGGPV